MKKLFFILLGIFIFSFTFPSKAGAGMLKVSISKLPEYENKNDFRVYYTYLETEGKTARVNLFIQKEGKGWQKVEDHGKTAVSGYFQIQAPDLYDGEGKYNFMISAGTDQNNFQSPTVTTILDKTSPGRVSGYGKSRIDHLNFHLIWTNPTDSDFARVYIYRSKEQTFTANADSFISDVAGTPGESKSWDNGVPQETTMYFYAIRSVDKAGNLSDVITDAPGTVTTTQQVEGISSVPGGSNKPEEVKILPKEKADGETGELGGGISSEAGKIIDKKTSSKTNTNYLVLGLLILSVISFTIYRRIKK